MSFSKSDFIDILVEELSEISEQNIDKLEAILEKLLDQLRELDLSIDYMASTLTGDDPLSLGVSQSALGRLTRAKQARVRTQETKLKLQDIIKEVISEQDVPQQIEKAVESDADLEELLSAMAERLRDLESEIEKVKSDYSAASSRMSQIIGQQK